MSYEGYTQVLCEKGHFTSYDAYSDTSSNKEWKCPVCKAKRAWYNLVDLTNGSFEGKKRIDGFVELEVDVPAQMCKCKECGNEHMIVPPTFKIPKKRKQRSKK